jgi:hypothetical protein
MFGVVFGVVVLAAVAGVAMWASDQITLQGERTLFSVKCEGGAWVGNHCTGKLVRGERYAFRVSKTRQEVIYWVRGAIVPSGKYDHCRVENRDNWQCELQTGENPAITRELHNGRPPVAAGSPIDAIHGVSKAKWYAMTFGFNWPKDADY